MSELIQALHDVSDDVPTAVLLVVGEETEAGYLDELRAMVRAYDLDDRVRFLGRRDDVPALMAGCRRVRHALHVRAVRVGLRGGHGDGAAGRRARQRRNGRGRRAGCDGPAVGARGPRRARPPTFAVSCSTLTRGPRTAKRGRERVERQFTTKRMADDTANVFADVLGRAEDRAGRSGTV